MNLKKHEIKASTLLILLCWLVYACSYMGKVIRQILTKSCPSIKWTILRLGLQVRFSFLRTE